MLIVVRLNLMERYDVGVMMRLTNLVMAMHLLLIDLLQIWWRVLLMLFLLLHHTEIPVQLSLIDLYDVDEVMAHNNWEMEILQLHQILVHQYK